MLQLRSWRVEELNRWPQPQPQLGDFFLYTTAVGQILQKHAWDKGNPAGYSSILIGISPKRTCVLNKTMFSCRWKVQCPYLCSLTANTCKLYCAWNVGVVASGGRLFRKPDKAHDMSPCVGETWAVTSKSTQLTRRWLSYRTWAIIATDI